jgi:hypothetical protein
VRRGLKLALFVAFLLAAHYAWARVGGGHTFSGGGHSYGGGGGGYHGGGWSTGSSYGGYSSGGDLYYLIDAIARLLGALVSLTVRHPLLGLPLDALILYVIYRIINSWQTGYDITDASLYSSPSSQLMRRATATSARERLERLREQDPNFSYVLLMDFLNALYSTLQHARGTNARLQAYAAYLSDEASASLARLSPGAREVKGVVVGSCTLVGAEPVEPGKPARITVEFEACYTEELATGGSQSWYARETWRLSRKPGVLSREPGRTRQIACPACGAPANADSGGRCPSCGNVVRSGDFDWFVDAIQCERETRPPLLTSDVAEQGTELPTLTDPHFAEANARLASQDPAFKWPAFEARTGLVFTQLQKAWSARKWELARPFETDCAFESHAYWIQEYRRQKLVNALKDIRLLRQIPVKITQDRYYTAITVRMVASMIDCTQTEDGKLVSGSPSRPRPFTEYWTFIRGRSAQPPKPGAGAENCPACGAPLKISMVGVCEYCHAKIVSGDFDWVLSSIEQDEAYGG